MHRRHHVKKNSVVQLLTHRNFQYIHNLPQHEINEYTRKGKTICYVKESTKKNYKYVDKQDLFVSDGRKKIQTHSKSST